MHRAHVAEVEVENGDIRAGLLVREKEEDALLHVSVHAVVARAILAGFPVETLPFIILHACPVALLAFFPVEIIVLSPGERAADPPRHRDGALHRLKLVLGTLHFDALDEGLHGLVPLLPVSEHAQVVRLLAIPLAHDLLVRRQVARLAFYVLTHAPAHAVPGQVAVPSSETHVYRGEEKLGASVRAFTFFEAALDGIHVLGVPLVDSEGVRVYAGLLPVDAAPLVPNVVGHPVHDAGVVRDAVLEIVLVSDARAHRDIAAEFLLVRFQDAVGSAVLEEPSLRVGDDARLGRGLGRADESVHGVELRGVQHGGNFKPRPIGEEDAGGLGLGVPEPGAIRARVLPQELQTGHRVRRLRHGRCLGKADFIFELRVGLGGSHLQQVHAYGLAIFQVRQVGLPVLAGVRGAQHSRPAQEQTQLLLRRRAERVAAKPDALVEEDVVVLDAVVRNDEMRNGYRLQNPPDLQLAFRTDARLLRVHHVREGLLWLDGVAHGPLPVGPVLALGVEVLARVLKEAPRPAHGDGLVVKLLRVRLA